MILNKWLATYSKREAVFAFMGMVLALLLMFGLALSSLRQMSPTYDEQGFITRGLGYVRGENRYMRVGHPAGLNAYNALLLAADERVALPTADPSWLLTSFHRPSELFMWEIGNDVARVLFLARLPTVWLGLLLAAIVGRWAGQMARRRAAGVVALMLIAFDPNILAHTSLATTDLGLAAAAGLAGYGLWLVLKRPFLPQALFAGITFGLLQNTKFTAGLFVPLFGIVILIYFAAWLWDAHQQRSQGHPPLATRHSPLKNIGFVILAYAVIAPFTLWASYGFQIGALPPDLPTFPQLGGMTVPLSHHLEQLLDIGGRLQKSTPAFLLGRYSDQGWWVYFPVAFLLKTPLPTLILLALAAAVRLKTYAKRPRSHMLRSAFLDDTVLLVPALGYFAFALTTDINLGYRHLLPILPFLAVFTANSLSPLFNSGRQAVRYLVPALLTALFFVTLWISPHFLSYFNRLAGGPDNGWRALVDSNIDWGQDLGSLKLWLDENGVETVWLSYFGEGRPDYYGIDYIGLDSWPPRLMNPAAQPFYPDDPAPGIYAISATTLQGVHFVDHDRFAWFREREPLDKVGYSIFLYEVIASGPPVDLALGGLQLDQLTLADFALLGSNEVTAHWFDPGQSWLLPTGGGFVALPPEMALPEWTTEWELLATQPAYALYRYPEIPVAEGRLFTQGEGRIAFLGEEGWPETMISASSAQAISPQAISLTTTWLKQSPPEPVKLFIHLIAPDGGIAAQWDGLTVPWEGWRSGDWLRQTHQLDLPENAAPGVYRLFVGLYHPETGTRWLLPDGADALLLGEITVK